MKGQAGTVLPGRQEYFSVCASKFYLYYKIVMTCKKQTDNKNNKLVVSTSGLKQ